MSIKVLARAIILCVNISIDSSALDTKRTSASGLFSKATFDLF